MIEYLDVLRWLHVIGACVLLGTGAGIAFFMVVAHRTARPEIIAHTAAVVVLADYLFTATAVIAQPITGYLLAKEVGWSMSEGWLLLSLLLYVVTGVFWLPVVWIQSQLRDMAILSVHSGQPLSDRYYRLFSIWFAFGFPAFGTVLTILWLMIARPEIGFNF